MQVPDHKEDSVAVENALFTVVLPEHTNNIKNNITLLTLHSHSYYEIFCCVSGSIEILTENDKYYLSDGDILFMPPGLMHRMNYYDGGSVFCTPGFYISEKGSFVYSDIYSRVLDSAAGKEPVIYNKAYELCRIAYGLCEGLSFVSCPALQMLTCILSLDRKEKPQIGCDNLLCDLDHVINNEFMLNNTCESIAKKLNISVRQLSRIVGKRYGMSLHKVLTLKRLSTAAEMLRSTDKSVESISLEVGYKSMSCFYREFVKRYGTTPAEYRRK